MRVHIQRPFVGVAVVVAAILSVCTVSEAGEDWAQFRGDTSQGMVAASCPEAWDSQSNVAWKIPLQGEGWSCPITVGNRLFLTEAVRVGGDRREQVYQWKVLCLDAQTGDELWARTAREGTPPHPRHSTNTYATETPVSDGEQVYAYFGMSGLYCYDLEGNPKWEVEFGSFELRAGWGTASSPVLYDDRLIIQFDNEERSALIAIDCQTGDELWRVTRDEATQYSSPIIWRNSLRDEIIVGGMTYRSYDPATGNQLWELDMEKGRSSATPLAVGDRLYVGTELRNRGGSDDGGGFLFALRPGGQGDISPARGETTSEYVVWKVPGSNIQMASPALCEGHLYLLERRAGVLNCVNAETGRIAYRTRISGASEFWSSPWTQDDKVYCLDDSGTTHVIAGGGDFEVVGQNALREQTWSTPAIANGKLYVRTVEHLYCIATED